MVETRPNTAAPPARRSAWRELVAKEDWWAIWIGLGLVVVAVTTPSGSLKWLAVAPTKWGDPAAAVAQFVAHCRQYLALFVLFAVLFGVALSALGFNVRRFLAVFACLYAISIVLYFVGQWDQSARYNLEPPLIALLLGLLISNTVGVPTWADAGLRVEFYIKTGIVLLGAGVPLTLILWAGAR